MTAPLNRDRLAKMLALLASPVDGEALAAARMVVHLLAAARMRPEELAAAQRPPVIVRQWEHFDRVMAEAAAKLREKVDALELELEPHRPELDWVALADRLRLPKAMEYRARTGKLDLADRVFIRRAVAEAEADVVAPAGRRRSRR